MDCNEAQKLIHLYIERKLNGEILEDFLDHVEQCKQCSDELEVYFTVYYAVKQLDNDETDFFDMKSLLDVDVKKARDHLEESDTKNFMKRFFSFVLAVTLIIFTGLCVECYITGGFSYTFLYKVITPDPVIIEAETEEISGRSEPETNHKKEVIKSIPETELYQEPPQLPDE